DEYIRFDFSHFSKMTDEEIENVEKIVNEKIAAQIALKEQRNIPYQDAIDSGVTALFGEKYGDYVRVITFDDKFSKELCGGCHVKNTSDIVLFKLISESAVSAGVRRIEAISGSNAINFLTNQSNKFEEIKDLLKNPVDVQKSIESLIEENHKVKKQLDKMMAEKASALKSDLLKTVKEKNGVHSIIANIDLGNVDLIKNLIFELKAEVSNAYILLAAEVDAKPHLALYIDENLVKEKNLNASNIIRELGKEIQGGGGGQAFFATAGGKNLEGIKSALLKAEAYI
ncbi:MAG: DHHA1 domain-containing protein, partial [bacterium]